MMRTILTNIEDTGRVELTRYDVKDVTHDCKHKATILDHISTQLSDGYFEGTDVPVECSCFWGYLEFETRRDKLVILVDEKDFDPYLDVKNVFHNLSADLVLKKISWVIGWAMENGGDLLRKEFDYDELEALKKDLETTYSCDNKANVGMIPIWWLKSKEKDVPVIKDLITAWRKEIK